MVVPVQPAVRIGPERGGHNGPAQHIFAKIPRKVEFLKKMDNVLKQCVEIALLPTAWQRHEAAAGKVKLNAHTSWKWAKPEKRKELEDRCRDDPSKLDEQGRHKGGAGNKKAGKHVKRMGEVNGPWFEEQETEIVRKILSERTNRSRVGSRGVRNWMRDLVRRATNHTADNVERAKRFTASRGWYTLFARRHGFVFRKKTNCRPKSILALLGPVVRFAIALKNMRAAHPGNDNLVHGKFGEEESFNMDQVPLAFIEGSHRGTIARKGDISVAVKELGSGLSKRQGSLNLIIRPRGRQPWPGLILRGSKNSTRKARAEEMEKFTWRTLPDGQKVRRHIFVVHQPKAWVDTDTAVACVEGQLFPFVVEEEIDEFLGLFDNLSSQRADRFKDALADRGGKCVFGPAGATHIWQPVDRHCGARYHVMLADRYDRWEVSEEARLHYEMGTTPSAARRRELMVDWVEDVYEQLERERIEKEALGQETIFSSAFKKTPCMISMTGTSDVDKLMDPEGVMEAIKQSGDPFFRDHKITSFQELVVCAEGKCEHITRQWITLTEQEETLDGEKFKSRCGSLEAADNPIARLVMNLLKSGYRWAGSSLIQFLGCGLDSLMVHLAAV